MNPIAEHAPPEADPFFGRMNSPTASAAIKGLCGDEMEFYLVIHDGRIEAVRYHTDGCANTRRCGSAVARQAQGQTLMNALAINPRDIIDSQKCLPEAGRHCAILAVSALYRAIADHLLAP